MSILFPDELDPVTTLPGGSASLGGGSPTHLAHHQALEDKVGALEGMLVGPAWFNVQDYGAVGDNTADDTAAIQLAMNAVGSTGGTVLFPPGIYKVTATLTVPDVRGFRMVGASTNASEIRMASNNTPIIKTSGQFQRGLLFEELRLSYSTQQTFASHPLSVALLITSAAATPSCYYSTFRRLYFEKATYGIKTGGTQMSVWGNTFEDIQCSAIEHSVITLIPSPATGQPVNTFRGIRSLADGGPAVTGTALDIYNECVMEAIDIEDWTGKIINLTSSAFSINGFHAERYTALDSTAIITADGAGSIDAVAIAGNAPNAITGILFNATGQVTLGRVRLNLTTAGTGQWVYLITGATSAVDVTYPVLDVGSLAYFMFPGSTNTYAATRVKAGTGGVQTITSATTTTLTEYGSVFTISGTTTITSLTASWAERRVTLIFSGALTFTDGSNLKLAGNLVTTADDTISLVSDGTNWYETSRSVN